MNTNETNPPLDNDENLEVIEHAVIASPDFKTDIDPIELLEALDSYIQILSHEPSETDIYRVQSELKSMVILTMNHKNESWWMNNPVLLHKHTMRRPMKKRIGHLLKTKGEWKSETVHKESIEIKSRASLPINLIVKPEAQAVVEDGTISELLLSVIAIHDTIEIMLENGDSSSGVFYRPEGVVHSNELLMWFDNSENAGLQDIKGGLEVTNLLDVAAAVTFTAKT